MVQWLGLHAFTAEGAGLIPVAELGSSKPRGAAKKKKYFLVLFILKA